MKPFICATKRFFEEIWSDAMLAMLLFVPIFMGLVFKFGVPALETYLCNKLNCAQIIAPYYPIFDLLLCVMTPLMFTSAGAMVILDEADIGLSRAISVTPIGRRGYLISRIGVPAIIATAYCFIATLIFKLSGIDAPRLALLAICSGMLSVVAALMIASMAKNKVEGLAYTKLTGLFVLGIPVALLVPEPYQYASALLPSFWMTKLALGDALWLALPAIASAMLLSAAFTRHFARKILA